MLSEFVAVKTELSIFLFIYLPIILFLVQKGLKAAHHKPHMEPESVSWWGGRQNGPVWADVGPEPCPESGPVWPHDSEMRGGSVRSPRSPRVTHQNCSHPSLHLIRVHVRLWFPGTQVSTVRTVCQQQQPPTRGCAAPSRRPLLAQETPELRAWRSVLK